MGNVNLVGYSSREDAIFNQKKVSEDYIKQEKRSAQITIIENMQNVEDAKMLLEALDLFEKVEFSDKVDPNFTRTYFRRID